MRSLRLKAPGYNDKAWHLDQHEDIFTYTVSDEALESAAEAKRFEVTKGGSNQSGFP